MHMFIYFLTLLTSFIFLQMNHPLAMGLILLIQTLLICLITGLMAKTFWFSYILFMIFIGGMLVLFIYVTSLASNEMFSLSMKTLILSLMFLLFTFLMFLLIDKMYFISFFSNNEMNSISMMKSFYKENTLELTKLYNFPSNIITIFMINYLLLTLIAIVKITKFFYGPLRQMN
uniref:NADH-ubiquinone oxidoreductase chain 6 n=1 Tax=Vermiophis taishanensis TaxID=2885621 RepID=A0A8K1KWW3_9DIPT|nr:NADH dehydrogenase subunit 6 [Vermiophis taishanensis]